MAYASYMPPVGGYRHSYPEITDHCRPSGEKTYPEHSYSVTGPARCHRCGVTEK
ncbi:hypothetical protein [Streptomyces sp. NPDC057794]|uniref:hypothetical protein n=1 Tax=Streptomyces sp. NPDC057794 TaxID=3346251 RepID=UPI0036A9CEB6